MPVFTDRIKTWLNRAKSSLQEQREQLKEDEAKIIERWNEIAEGTDPSRAELWLRNKREGLHENEDIRCTRIDEPDERRNHLIFIDGTGNDQFAGDETTNVFRLFESILESDETGAPQHIAYYAGVGSEEDDPNPVSALFRQFGGLGATRIRDTAYMELIREYHPGDRIILIGFSRGAAIARMLANQIYEQGIPRTAVARFVPLGDDLMVLDRVESTSTDIHSVDIEALAVWDTVAAFGYPQNRVEPFKNLTIAANIKRAYHLLAIDEDREAFLPTLMTPADHIEEVWFAGVHADVGGGYEHRELAEIPLAWMANVLAQEHDVALSRGRISESHTLGKQHQHGKPWPKQMRTVETQGGAQPPVIHKSVYERIAQSQGSILYRPAALTQLGGPFADLNQLATLPFDEVRQRTDGIVKWDERDLS